MKQTKTGSFNIIDVFIILTVLILAALAVYFIFFSGFGAKDTVKIDFTMEIPVLRSEFNDRIKIGDTVISTVSRDKLGTVVAVEYTNASSATTNMESGEMQIVDYPEGVYSKLVVTVRSDASLSSNMYYVGATGVYVGATVYFRVPDFVTGAVCTQITPLS